MDCIRNKLLEELLRNVEKDVREEVELMLKEDLTQRLIGQFDFCIINSESDINEVEEFKNNFCKQYNLTGVYDGDGILSNVGQFFKRSEEMLERSTLTFIYLTENFLSDAMCIFQKDELLLRHIQDPQNHNNIIPIYTKPFNKFSRKLPIGIGLMTGFKLYSESRDHTRIKNTFDNSKRRLREIREHQEFIRLRREYQIKVDQFVNKVKSNIARYKTELEKRRMQQTDSTTDEEADEDSCSEDSQSDIDIPNKIISHNTVINSEKMTSLHLGNVFNIQTDNAAIISEVLGSCSSSHQVTLNGNPIAKKGSGSGEV